MLKQFICKLIATIRRNSGLFLGWLRCGVGALAAGATCFAERCSPYACISSRKGGGASYVSAFRRRVFKVASTVGLLVLAQALYRDVHWLALFQVSALALKANLFAFW